MPPPSASALSSASPDDYLFEAPAYEGVEEVQHPKPVSPRPVKSVSAPETSKVTAVSSEASEQVQQDVGEDLPSVSFPEPSVVAENKSERLMVDTAPDVVTEGATEQQEDNKWYDLLPELRLGGMAKQLAEHCLFKEQLDDKIVLFLDNAGVTLQTSRTEEALAEALSQYSGKEIRLEFEVSHSIGETPEKRRIRLAKERQLEAEQSIEQDLFVKELREKWGGVVLPGSVKPNLNVDTF